MDADTAMRLLTDTLVTAAWLSGPLLLVILVVGLAISVLQVVTQVQEMTLTFVPKLIAVGLTLVALGSWMLTVVVEFAQRLITSAAGM